jgi:hypothetical protein
MAVGFRCGRRKAGSNVGWKESGICQSLKFKGPFIAYIFPSITNKMRRYTIFFISVKCSKCFRRYPHPSSGAQNCIYSIGYLSNLYFCLLLSWKSWNVTQFIYFTEVNKLCNVASYCLYLKLYLKKYASVYFFFCLRLRNRRKLDNEKLHDVYSL